MRSSLAELRCGELCGLRDRSTSPSLPFSRNRSIHLYPVVGLMPKRRHSSRTLAPSWLASCTNSCLCIIGVLFFHGIPLFYSPSFPPKKCPPCPRQCVHYVPDHYTEVGPYHCAVARGVRSVVFSFIGDTRKRYRPPQRMLRRPVVPPRTMFRCDKISAAYLIRKKYF